MSNTLQEWAGASRIVALVFTDIIDSTTLGNQLGDEQWIELLLKHFLQGRNLINKHGGFEIKIIGDAFMAAFRTAVNALDFALEFQDNTGDKRIMIRIGIHVGPVRIIENDIFGMMVNYTKRVESQAEDNPVTMLSNEAKSHIDYEKATRHSDLEFIPKEVRLKGFAEPQKLWIVFDTEGFRKALATKIKIPNKKPSVMKKLLLG
jgi:class 3 adenylate cyclase